MTKITEAAVSPCPFCGSIDITILKPTVEKVFPVARCMRCFADVPGENWDKLGMSAVNAWNRRAAAPHAPTPDAVQAAVAFEKISELQYSEADWPLDDAIAIARKWLAAFDPSRLPPSARSAPDAAQAAVEGGREVVAAQLELAAQDRRQAWEHAGGRELDCSDKNSALEYGRCQGMEIAAALVRARSAAPVPTGSDGI